MAEGVTEVAWTGGELPDAWYDEFVFRGRLAGFAPGTVVYFPVVQECPDGAVHRWIEIPAAGKCADDYEEPAPGVTITAKPAAWRRQPGRRRQPPAPGSPMRLPRALALAALALLLLPPSPRPRRGARHPGGGAAGRWRAAGGPPAELVLRFNEPVAPVAVRLLDARGAEIPGVTVEPRGRRWSSARRAAAAGAYLLSYRVTSIDAHPSAPRSALVSAAAPACGEPKSPTGRQPLGGPRRALAGLRHGARRRRPCPLPAPGAPAEPVAARTGRWLVRLALAGIAATALRLGVAGLELAGLPLAGLASTAPWTAGPARRSPGPRPWRRRLGRPRRRPAGVGRGRRGLAWAVRSPPFALTGHAATAAAALADRPRALLHTLCGAFWLASLVPLWWSLRLPAGAAHAVLRRFSDHGHGPGRRARRRRRRRSPGSSSAATSRARGAPPTAGGCSASWAWSRASSRWPPSTGSG